MTTTSSEPPNEEQATEHLDDLDDGCGCAEVWEHLSERREAGRENGDDETTQAAVEQ